MTKAITFESVLRAVVFNNIPKSRYVYKGTEKLSYHEFENTLMFGEPPITTSRRAVRDKWRILIDHEFFKTVNQYDVVLVNLEKVNTLVFGPECKKISRSAPPEGVEV